MLPFSMLFQEEGRHEILLQGKGQISDLAYTARSIKRLLDRDLYGHWLSKASSFIYLSKLG